MKTNHKKVIILTGILTAVISLWAVHGEASVTKSLIKEIVELNSVGVNEYFFYINATSKTEGKMEVRIYNSEDQLIRVAKEGSIILEPVINKADYLLEVDGVKYYRINQ